MKRFGTALAAALLGLGLMAGCGGYNTSIQYSTGATITNISPSGTVFGDTSDLTLTVTASPSNPFQVGTIVEWNGQKLTTTPLTAAAITVTATVPKALLATPGTAYVTTFEPQTGTGNNGLSNALTFIIYGNPNPVPTITSISPSSAQVCTSNCQPLSITITGTNFLGTKTNGGSSVTITGLANGQVQTAINVNSISSTQIKATIPVSPTNYFGTADPNMVISVVNPPSAVCLVNCPNLGGGTAKFTFPVGSTASGASTSATSAAAAEETPAVSQDGRYVAFTSEQNGTAQIVLRDTCVGAPDGCAPATQLISAATDGTAGSAESHMPSMSSDARYVAFSSAATNLLDSTSGSTAAAGRQIFLRDTCVGAASGCKPTTTLVSTDSAGSLNGTEGILPSISATGRFVAFVAVTKSNSPSSTNGATASANTAATTPNSGLRQVFVRDTCLGAANCTPKTTRISMQPGDGNSSSTPVKPAGPALSGLAKQIALPDGRVSTVFTQAVPVDDKVFLAITNQLN
jgi:Tol biopolymer transport system component